MFLASPSRRSSPTQPSSIYIMPRLLFFLQHPHAARPPPTASGETDPVAKLILQYPHSGRAQRNISGDEMMQLTEALAVPSLGSSPTQPRYYTARCKV